MSASLGHLETREIRVAMLAKFKTVTVSCELEMTHERGFLSLVKSTPLN